MKTEHGLSYKVFNYADFMEMSPEIRRMVTAYIERAGDKFTVDQIMDMMQVAIGAPNFFVFVAMKDGYGVGLMTAHAVVSNDIEASGMVHIGYVDETVTPKESKDIIALAMEELFNWAERCEMTRVYITSQRKEKPFDKLLGQFGFQRMTTVYEKEISHGRKDSDNSGEPTDGGNVGSDGHVQLAPSKPASTGPTPSRDAALVK